MEIREYNYLLEKVTHPTEDSYFIKRIPLPDWIYLTITKDYDSDSKYLTVYSSRHPGKGVDVGHTYTASSNDADLIKDLSTEIAATFLSRNAMDIKSEISALVRQVLKVKPSMKKEDVLTLSLNQIANILAENEQNERRKKRKEQDRKDLKCISNHLSMMCERDKYPELLNNLKIFIKQQVPSCTN